MLDERDACLDSERKGSGRGQLWRGEEDGWKGKGWERRAGEGRGANLASDLR